MKSLRLAGLRLPWPFSSSLSSAWPPSSPGAQSQTTHCAPSEPAPVNHNLISGSVKNKILKEICITNISESIKNFQIKNSSVKVFLWLPDSPTTNLELAVAPLRVHSFSAQSWSALDTHGDHHSPGETQRSAALGLQRGWKTRVRFCRRHNV